MTREVQYERKILRGVLVTYSAGADRHWECLGSESPAPSFLVDDSDSILFGVKTGPDPWA